MSSELGLGGNGVTCSPRDPWFAGSNPAEVDGFFQDVKILSTSPPGGTLIWGSRVWDFRLVKESHAWKIGLWTKFNRHIHVLVIPKFGGAQYIAMHWAAMTTLSMQCNAIQYNTIQMSSEESISEQILALIVSYRAHLSTLSLGNKL